MGMLDQIEEAKGKVVIQGGNPKFLYLNSKTYKKLRLELNEVFGIKVRKLKTILGLSIHKNETIPTDIVYITEKDQDGKS